MDLKGFEIYGHIVIAENEAEAIEMYLNSDFGKAFGLYDQPKEINLDEWFYYFNINEIDKADYKHIYDRRYPEDGVELVSLKRPYARKYMPEGFYNKKEIVELMM